MGSLVDITIRKDLAGRWCQEDAMKHVGARGNAALVRADREDAG